MRATLSAFAHRIGRTYVQRVIGAEMQSQRFTHHNERSIEYRFALEVLASKRPITVLDVGTGTTAWPHLLRNCGFVVTAIDNVRDYWPHGMQNRHWPVLDVNITSLRGFERTFDALTCISVMEHIEDHASAFSNMLRLLKSGGVLILTTPYNHFQSDPNVYKRADALYGADLPYICRSHCREHIQTWEQLGARLVGRELWQAFTGPVWATGQRTSFTKAETEDQPHQLACLEFLKI